MARSLLQLCAADSVPSGEPQQQQQQATPQQHQQQQQAAPQQQQAAPQQQQQQQRQAAPAVYSNSTSVYIGNLQWWTTDAEVEALCGRFGAVERLRFFEEKPTGKSKGYALVGFDSAKAAHECKQGLDGCACRTGLTLIEDPSCCRSSPMCAAHSDAE